MILRINRYLYMDVVNSIGQYAFKEMKNNKNFRNLDVLKSFCAFTKQINEEGAEGDSEVIEVEADENITGFLPGIIEKYIFEEISECEEPNFEWVMEMMNIHSQLTDDTGGNVQDVKDKSADGGLDPAQEIKNRSYEAEEKDTGGRQEEKEEKKETEEEIQKEESIQEPWSTDDDNLNLF